MLEENGNLIKDEELKTDCIYYHPLNNIMKDKIKSGEELLEREYIKFLSYKLSFESPLDSLTKTTFSDIKMKNFYKKMSKYDIICVQSVSSTFSKRRNELIREATRQGFFFSVESQKPGTFSTFGIDSGIIIFSRFPIIKKAYVPFPNSVYSDTTIQKGFVYVKIQIKDQFIHVLNTELQSNESEIKQSSSDTFINCFRTRQEQLLILSKFIRQGIIYDEEFHHNDDLIILCGNFNLERIGEKFIEEIKSKGNSMTEYEDLHYIIEGEKDSKCLDMIDLYKDSPDEGVKSGEDYVFILKEKDFNLSRVFQVSNCIIERFNLSDFENENLSKHNGLTFEINFNEVPPDQENPRKTASRIPENIKGLVL